MKKPSKGKKNPGARKKKGLPWLYISFLLATLLVSAGVSYLYFEKMFEIESAFITDMESRQAGIERGAAGDESQRLYEPNNGEETVQDNVISRKDESLGVAENIIRKHFTPLKTRLLDLYFDRRGRMYIDVGSEITKNFKGDAYEELSLIATLYKKIKSAVPGLTSLKILIDSREADSLGGHIDISRAIGDEIGEHVD